MKPEVPTVEPLDAEIPARCMTAHSDRAGYITEKCAVVDDARWLSRTNGFAWDNPHWDRAREGMRGAR